MLFIVFLCLCLSANLFFVALSLRKVKSDSVFATIIASSEPITTSDKQTHKSRHHMRHLSLTKSVISKSQSNASKQNATKSKTLPGLRTKSFNQLGTKTEKVPVQTRSSDIQKTLVAMPKQSTQKIIQKVKFENQPPAKEGLVIPPVTSIHVNKQKLVLHDVPQHTNNLGKQRLNQDIKQPHKSFTNTQSINDQRLQKQTVVNQKNKLPANERGDLVQKVNQPVSTVGVRKDIPARAAISCKPELNRTVKEKIH